MPSGRYPKFEVCFARSMNAMHKDIDDSSKGHPEMQKVKQNLKKMKLTKLKKWEKELGAYAHQDLKNHW